MEFKAVSMPCTQAQWEEIRRELYFFGIQNEDITDFETDRFLVNNYMSVNNLVTNIPPSEIVKHGRMFFPTYNKQAFLEACGVDYKNVLEPNVAEKNSFDEVFHLSKEQIHALNNGTTTVKKLFPDLFTKIEEGKWYENFFGSVFCTTKIGNYIDRVEGFGFCENRGYYEESTWLTREIKPADMEKVKALFKTEIENSYKAGMWIKQQWNENHVCKLADEPLCFNVLSCFRYAFLGKVCVFHKGQFAEIPTITKQEAENQLKINIE
jgi:hypothetical protein